MSSTRRFFILTWLEAVHVVALVAAVAEEERVLVVAAVAELAEGLHDGLVPRDRGLQDVESHGQLGSGLGLANALAPSNKT